MFQRRHLIQCTQSYSITLHNQVSVTAIREEYSVLIHAQGTQGLVLHPWSGGGIEEGVNGDT